MQNKLVVVLILLLLIITNGCTKSSNNVQNGKNNELNQNNYKIIKGVSLSPKSFQKDDFLDFFNKAKETGNIISWEGDWIELGNSENSAPKTLMGLSKIYDFTPLIIVQFFSQDSGKLLRPLNEDNINKYKTITINFVKEYEPQYLGLGIEINTLYSKSPEDFEKFVEFYPEIYKSIKEVSPNTKVFTNFNLETMKGLHGGLFGGTNDPDKSQWVLLDRFDSDLITFSTYPFLIYKTPDEMPSDYYTEINSHTSKPIAFTEIGWHSDDKIRGWESSEIEQAEFITKFFTLTKNLNLKIAIWSFMYDQEYGDPFNYTGLISRDGSKKPAFDTWVKEN